MSRTTRAFPFRRGAAPRTTPGFPFRRIRGSPCFTQQGLSEGREQQRERESGRGRRQRRATGASAWLMASSACTVRDRDGGPYGTNPLSDPHTRHRVREDRGWWCLPNSRAGGACRTAEPVVPALRGRASGRCPTAPARTRPAPCAGCGAAWACPSRDRRDPWGRGPPDRSPPSAGRPR